MQVDWPLLVDWPLSGTNSNRVQRYIAKLPLLDLLLSNIS